MHAFPNSYLFLYVLRRIFALSIAFCSSSSKALIGCCIVKWTIWCSVSWVKQSTLIFFWIQKSLVFAFSMHLFATSSQRAGLAVHQKSEKVFLTVVNESEILYRAFIYCTKVADFRLILFPSANQLWRASSLYGNERRGFLLNGSLQSLPYCLWETVAVRDELSSCSGGKSESQQNS